MRDSTIISFCLPCYNVKMYVEDCISSIVMQDLSADTYEIICVDDCSTDDTISTLYSLQKRYSNMHVIKNDDNHGVSYTRNKLINVAKGKYIWFVDPDDLLCPDVVKQFYEIIEKINADVLWGNYYRISENDSIDAYDLSNNKNNNIPYIMAGDLPTDQNGIHMNAIWAGLIRTDFLIKNKLKFNEKMITQEDTLLYYEMGVKSKQIYKIEKTVYLYRQRKSSVMNTHSDERNMKTYHTMLEMLRIYVQHKDKKQYDDLSVLNDKILHSRQNVTSCLAVLSDKKYVKNQLKILKKEGIYPYKFRLRTLKERDNILVRILKFLLPIEPFFWLYHSVYKRYNKKRNSK